MKTTLLIMLALLAFAANSVLCRLALAGGEIDALGFTLLRLCSGALVLAVLLLVQKKRVTAQQVSQQKIPALMLLGYAFAFSYAYLSLETGAGALILFASVQITMMLGGIIRGQKPSKFELLGMFLASTGLVYWLLPYWGSPSLIGFVLMVLSGFCWGVYSLLGQKPKASNVAATNTVDPITATAINFLWTIPVVAILLFWHWSNLNFTAYGLFLAVTSGALTSALGYVVWYEVVPSLTPSQAAVLQLLVPVLAAMGGVFWSNEMITTPLLVAGLLVFSGVLVSQKK